MDRRQDLQTERIVAFLLALAAAAVYLKALSFPFLLADDPTYTYGNPQVRAGLRWSGVAWAFTSLADLNWVPLTLLSHMLVAQLFGLGPAAHHLANVALHAVNTVLLFAVLRGMTGEKWRSAFVAAVFAVHPLHVESVAWVAARKDLLFALFWLLALRAYAGYSRAPSAGRYAAVFLLFAAGLLSKATMIAFPVVLLLVDRWPLDRFRSAGWPRLVLEKAPLALAAVAALVLTYLAQERGGAVSPFPLAARVENALTACVGYLAKAAWPHPLAFYYVHPASIGKAIPAWKIAGAALAVGGASVLALAERTRRPWLLAGWGWYLASLAPAIGLVQVGGQAMADRYMYLPIAGLAIVAAWGIPELSERWRLHRGALAGAAAAALAGFTAVTWIQLDSWRTTATLLEHTVAVTSDNWWAENHLGKTYAESGDLERAARHYRAAMRISPGYKDPRKQLGNLLLAEGKPGEAAALFLDALRIDPNDLEAQAGLGVALEAQGRTEEAAARYRDVLRARPGFAGEERLKGDALASGAMWFEAAGDYRLAACLDPGDADARVALGTALARRGKFDEAVRRLREALAIRPGSAAIHDRLGSIMMAAGSTGAAIAEFREALRLAPGDPGARANLEAALAGKRGGAAR